MSELETLKDITNYMRSEHRAACTEKSCIRYSAECGEFDAIMNDLADRIDAAAKRAFETALSMAEDPATGLYYTPDRMLVDLKVCRDLLDRCVKLVDPRTRIAREIVEALGR